jgi:Taurine catabolism dioxygenase TauD, TfdA family
VERYTHEENIIIYAGIASHIAPLFSRQDNTFSNSPADVVIGHIKDLSTQLPSGTIGSPAYTTTESQAFHTDNGSDIVALFCLAEAAEGGESYLSSSWRVYNELAATRPDIIETLSEPWAFEEYFPPPQSTLLIECFF